MRGLLPRMLRGRLVMRSFVKYQFQLSWKLMACLFLAQGTPKRRPDRVWEISACSRRGSEGAGTVLLLDLSGCFLRNKEVHSPSGQRMLLCSKWKQTLKHTVLSLHRDLYLWAAEILERFLEVLKWPSASEKWLRVSSHGSEWGLQGDRNSFWLLAAHMHLLETDNVDQVMNLTSVLECGSTSQICLLQNYSFKIYLKVTVC